MKKIKLFSISLAMAFLCLGCKTKQGTGKTKQAPNVVIVITDDQGYGDLAFTGTVSYTHLRAHETLR